MSVFLEQNHLFLRNPHGGVEDVAAMKAAGFNAIFCNIGDHDPDEWSIVRQRAAAASVVCGPWLRVADGGSGDFDPNRLEALLTCADAWASPLIVNAESELKGSGPDLTSYIARECEDRDWALSMEPIPFANVDWTPIKVPVLPQCFGPEFADAVGLRALWQTHGVSCVVATFGTYSGWTPDLYDRLMPYGLYTADDCGNQFARWSAQGSVNPCKAAPVPPPQNGDDMIVIGPNHGITATCNRLRDMDPGGTILVKSGGKWPSIDTLTSAPSAWGAYDRLERTLKILVAEHDEEASQP